jgi:nucleotide-binding universal stress UspA family protein
MPFLTRAEQVTVLTVEGETVPGPSGAHLAQHLVRNGINASALTVEPKGRSGGAAFLEEARVMNADLMLKGAYTHTRLRQMIFGGLTRHILTHAELPVLLAH